MLWFALHPPALSLEAFAAALPPGPRARPLALLGGHRIAAADARAARAGVLPGQKRATALALAPDLTLGQADPARDAAALLAIAHAALAFTPSVAIAEAHVVLLEVQASLRFFGGAAALLGRLREALAPLGHRLRVAAAPTAEGAALLARGQGDDEPLGPPATRLAALRERLDALPLHGLRSAAAHLESLQGMGLQRLGDLRRLPRDGLVRRFGEALLDEIDRALGTRPDPRRWVVAPERFDSRLELPERADRAEQVLHGAARLLTQLLAWAQARQARVAAFTLQMQHETRHRVGERTPAATELRVALAEPSADAAHLQLLLRERLAGCRLAAPTLELRLCCDEAVQVPAPNGELFPDRGSGELGLARLLDRLRARLGDAQVQRLQPLADHRPELGAAVVPVAGAPGGPAGRVASGAARGASGVASGAASGAARRAASAVASGAAASGPSPAPAPPGLALAHPVWLLPDALPLPERQALPLLDGQPLRLLAGPERIEAGWWDGALATRDYYIAQATDGSLVWVYRRRLPGGDPGQADWYLQGRFG